MENPDYFHTLLHSTPPMGGVEIFHAVCYGKLELSGYSMLKNAVRQNGRLTDGQTERHLATSIVRAVHTYLLYLLITQLTL